MECRLSAACLCNMGRVRGNNEDNFYFDGRTMPLDHTSLDKPPLQDVSTSPFAAFGVFDGMGGEETAKWRPLWQQRPLRISAAGCGSMWPRRSSFWPRRPLQ